VGHYFILELKDWRD